MVIVLHGVYRLARRVVAYRNDYCLTCNATGLAFQHRTFDLYHLFFVPVLPLGLHRRWRCAKCGQDPHLSGRVRSVIRWAGTLTLGLIVVLAWAEMGWVARVALLCATALALAASLYETPEAGLDDKLRQVPALNDPACPRCNVFLVPGEPWWTCPRCGIARSRLSAA